MVQPEASVGSGRHTVEPLLSRATLPTSTGDTRAARPVTTPAMLLLLTATMDARVGSSVLTRVSSAAALGPTRDARMIHCATRNGCMLLCTEPLPTDPVLPAPVAAPLLGLGASAT